MPLTKTPSTKTPLTKIKNLVVIGFVFAAASICQAQKAYEIEAGASVPIETQSPPLRSTSVRTPSIKAPLASVEQYDEFESAVSLRTKRRVGAGVLTAGQLGLLGLITELNYSPYHSAVIGFGGGPRYSSLTLQYKYLFGGRVVSPYFTVGYSRWYSNSTQKKPVGRSFPSVLTDKILTDEEKETGIFGKDLLVPSLGIQYTQLYGRSVGTSLYAELVMMVNANDFQATPTGAFGMFYYF